jgi:hypothetical protein
MQPLEKAEIQPPSRAEYWKAALNIAYTESNVKYGGLLLQAGNENK